MCVEIYSATLHTKFVGAHVRQIYWIIAGIIVMIVASRVNYQALLENVPWMYIISIISLVAVLLFGQKYLGARRWIRIGGATHFQPSEWVKLILILAMAKYFCRPIRFQDMCFTDLLKAGSVVGLPMLLVLVQPDLGHSPHLCCHRDYGSLPGGHEVPSRGHHPSLRRHRSCSCV